jgi:protein PET117
MSSKAKITLATTTVSAIAIVVFVHYQQRADKAVRAAELRSQALANAQQAMHQGVIRDMEQQKIKRERQLDFEMQRQMEEEYRKVQKVSDGKAGA